MARLDARWLNFWARGQSWYHFWQDAAASGNISNAGNIASAEAIGVASITLLLSLTGIASSEVIGAGSVQEQLSPSGIATLEAVGQPATVISLSPNGIGSGEAVGTASLTCSVSPTGVVGAEAFGQPTVSTAINLTNAGNIASSEAIGTPTVSYVVSTVGISTSAAIGQPVITLTMTPTGIVSSEAVGTAFLTYSVSVTGIASAEVVCAPTITCDVVPEVTPTLGGSGFAAKKRRDRSYDEPVTNEWTSGPVNQDVPVTFVEQKDDRPKVISEVQRQIILSAGRAIRAQNIEKRGADNESARMREATIFDQRIANLTKANADIRVPSKVEAEEGRLRREAGDRAALETQKRAASLYADATNRVAMVDQKRIGTHSIQFAGEVEVDEGMMAKLQEIAQAKYKEDIAATRLTNLAKAREVKKTKKRK